MTLARFSLWLSAAAFAAPGAAFLVAPSLLGLVDLDPATPTARNDVRAVFGGLELGVAGALAACARRPAWHRAGLVLQLLAFGGLAAGRLVGLALDGAPRSISFALWLLELVGAAVAAVAAVALRRLDDRR